MVTAFDRHLVTKIGVFIVAAVPVGLLTADVKTGPVRRTLVADMVEDVKFKFRPDAHLIGDAGRYHVFLSPGGDGTGVLVEAVVFRLGDDKNVTDHAQGGDFGKWISDGGADIGYEYHIAPLDRGVAVIGAIETDAVDQGFRFKTAGGNA